MTDVLLACDLIVGSSGQVLKTVRPGHTAAILNTDVAPTGDFQSNKYLDLGEARLRAAIIKALDGGACFDLQASRLATDLTGDSIGTNILMLGYAAQKGLLPLSVKSIQEAIRLNGTFVDGNLRTFALGRLAAHDPSALAAELDSAPVLPSLDTVEDVLGSRIRLLADYQDAAYAESYRSYVEKIRQAVAAKGFDIKEEFARQVAISLAKLMSYKDEYEVARLYTNPLFMQRIREQFSGDFKLSFNLAPPILPGRDKATGRPKKRSFGPWMLSVFRLLSKMKRLRGTVFDVFGYFPERKMERQLVNEYRALIENVVVSLHAGNLDSAIRIAAAAQEIGGYGSVKEASVKRYQSELNVLLGKLHLPEPSRIASEKLKVVQM